MESVRLIQKKYCYRAMAFAIFTGFFLIIAGQRSIGKGLILGTLFSVVNFVLIGETLPLKIGKTRVKTFFVSFGSIFFRYFLLAAPLILAIKFEQFNLFSVMIGIFMVQIVILADHVFGLISSTRGKQV